VDDAFGRAGGAGGVAKQRVGRVGAAVNLFDARANNRPALDTDSLAPKLMTCLTNGWLSRSV
jgi:hypothetical protein